MTQLSLLAGRTIIDMGVESTTTDLPSTNHAAFKNMSY